MTYREWTPPPRLASHVACVWSRTGGLSRVLPDGCVDLVWTGAELIVAGPATRAVVPELPPGEPKVGVRFRVGTAGAAFGVPAVELLDRTPRLDDVWPGGEELAARVADARDGGTRIALMCEAVAARLAHAPEPDPLVRQAALQLSRPRAQVSAVSKRLAISERQLRRRFEHAVGYPPRTLARVLRLQRFLALAVEGSDLARLAAAAGYCDQPHLTRECTDLAGLPAAALLAAGAGPAGERLSSA